MDSGRSKAPAVSAVVYLLAVIFCMLMAFDFEGSIDTNWTLALIALTLPWSAISILFAWGLIHGAGLEIFAVFYLICAAVNAAIIYKLGSLHAGKKAAPAPPAS